MTERLRPTYLISAGAWTNAASAVADVASVRQPIEAHDNDLSFITQLGTGESVFSCQFNAPLGTPNTGSGPVSWSLRAYAKRVNGAPASLTMTLLEGETTIAGPFEPSLTANYASLLMLFDPALIQDVRDVRLEIASAADGLNVCRITAVDLSIQVLEESLTNARLRAQGV